MSASELGFLIGAMSGSFLTGLVYFTKAQEARVWRERCHLWMDRYIALNRRDDLHHRLDTDAWRHGGNN